MKGPAFFQGEIITKAWNYIYEIKKSSSPEPLSQFQPKLGAMHPWVKGIQVCSNEEKINSHKVNNGFFSSLNQC